MWIITEPPTPIATNVPTAEELRFDGGEMTFQEQTDYLRRELKKPPSGIGAGAGAKWDAFWGGFFAYGWVIFVVPPVEAVIS